MAAVSLGDVALEFRLDMEVVELQSLDIADAALDMRLDMSIARCIRRGVRDTIMIPAVQ